MTTSAANIFLMKTGYLSGPIYDNTLIFGILAISLISGFLVLLEPKLFIPILFLDLWFLGYHHVIATFTKLAGTKQDRQDNRFLIYYLPFLVLAAVLLIHYQIGIIAIVTIYFFWQWYHYTRQAYGISVFYRRKAGIEDSNTPTKLDHAALWALPVWGILHRCAQGWDEFLFLPVWMPPIPMWFSTFVGCIALFIVMFWLASKIMDWAQGKLAYAPFFFMISHHIVFLVSYILIADITIGWLVVNIWHNAQYILFVWLFNQNRFKSEESKKESPLLHWLSQRSPYRTLAYFSACVLVTSIVYGGLSTGINIISNENAAMVLALSVILYQSINFHHYIVDSLIWKARKKSNRKIMNVD